MHIPDLYQSYKHFALAEKGMKFKSFKSIWASLTMLCNYTGNWDLKSLDTELIRTFFYHGRGERGWSVQTFRNHWLYLKLFFDWAVTRGFIKTNQVLPLQRPKPKQHLPRFLTKQAIRSVLGAVSWYPWRYRFEKPRNEAILAMLAMTGLRLQELLDLQTQDLNLTTEMLQVRQGKGSKDRWVPIHRNLKPVLRSFLAARINQQKQSPWLFTGVKSNKKLRQKDVRTICRKISTAIGIKFTPHMLRHSFARELVNNDFNLYKLKEILGHAQIKTTQIYLSVSDENIKRSFGQCDLFDRGFSKG